MQEKNSDFFYDIDLNHNFHIRNVFWVDARSDTTYLTDKCDMSSATFVGVNHDVQGVLLGCGLLSRKDTKSFMWLFKSWLRCMSGISPKQL